MSHKVQAALLACLFAISGCNLIFKQNIQQGNAIEQDKLDQLRTGMTMSQVAFLLGTPAIQDPFHQSRWDYIYTFSPRGRDMTTRTVTLFFDNARLVRMVGVSDEQDAQTLQSADTGPAEPSEDVDSPLDAAPQTQITPLATPDSETLVDVSPDDTEVVDNTPAPGPAEETAEPVVGEVPDAAHTEADVTEAGEVDAWIVQLGAFDSLQNARDLVARVQEAGFDVAIQSQSVSGLGERFLVRSKPYASREEAERQMQQINQAFDLGAYLIPPSD
ncbi:MAG: outer membrane protein assembly factor BamE [Xanthomonadales bacterium]|nr:outer membrane protein assembly factor BamE [Xanthomonadales bacterium]